jgi:hypothetical protein
MRYIKGDVRDSLWSEVVDVMRDTADEEYPHKSMLEVCKTIKGNRFDDHRMRLVYNGHQIIADGFVGSATRVAKMKSKTKFTHMFIDEFIEIPDSKSFDDLNTTLRPFLDEASGILVKPQVYCAFNMPDKEHWVVQRYFNLLNSSFEGFYKVKLKEQHKNLICPIFATYKDNTVWLKSLVKEGGMEYMQGELYRMFLHYKDSSLAQDKARYKVEVLGLVPSGKLGRIFTDWKVMTYEKWREIDATPIFGIDFGYAHDTTAVSGVKKYNGVFYVHNFINEIRLMGTKLAAKIKKEIPGYHNYSFYCDAGDGGRAMDELVQALNIDNEYDITNNFIKASKGQGSRSVGVTFMEGFEFYYTEESAALAKELAGYCWLPKKDGGISNEPADGGDDIMDSIRYPVFSRYHPSNANIWDSIYSTS